MKLFTTLSTSAAAMVAVAALLLASPTTSYADTYQVFNLGNDNGHNLYGIDVFGAVVTIGPNFGDPIHDHLYTTWVNGVVASTSFTPPSLNYDDGTSCVPTLSPGITIAPGSSRCNNGHEVYFGSYPTATPPFYAYGIFTGPNLSDLLPTHGTLDGVFLNALGDFAWIDGRDEFFYQAIDLTTRTVPEPGSLLLFGTGLLASIGEMRRRIF
jgi:hypothetical protein